jgi:hypothetical protein
MSAFRAQRAFIKKSYNKPTKRDFNPTRGNGRFQVYKVTTNVERKRKHTVLHFLEKLSLKCEHAHFFQRFDQR